MSKQWRKSSSSSPTDPRSKMSIAGEETSRADRSAARAGDSYLPPTGNIQYPVVNFRGRLRGVPFTRSVYATCVSRIRRGFPRKELSASRKDCATSLPKSSAETSSSLVSPRSLFLPRRAVFSFYPLAFFLRGFSLRKTVSCIVSARRSAV